MKKQLLTIRMLLVVAMLCLGVNVSWATDPIETVGTEGSGDAWASRKFSSAYELAPGETYHFTFVNHNYNATVRWYNWLLDCVNSSEKDASGFPTGTYYFTLRSDVYGWGDSYSATDNVSNYNTANDWADYCTMMDGATVDMYVNYSSNDKKVRTYVNITGSDSKKYYFNNTSAAIDASSVFLLLSEEMAYLEITTAEKSSTYKNYVYSREVTANCHDTWSASDIVTTETAGKWLTSTSGDGNRGLFIVADKGLMTRTRGNTNIDTGTLLLSRTANSIVTFDAVWNVGDSDKNGHQQGYGQYCSIQYGDLLIKCCLDTRSSSYTYTINGKETSLGASAGSLLNTDLTIHLVVNSSTNEISEFYIKNGTTTLAQFSDLTAQNNAFAAGTNYDKVITKADISGISSTNDFNYLKSITIQQETQAVTAANVTFKYEDTAGNSLSAYKADQVYEDVVVGTDISDVIIATYTNTFYNGTSNKYVYANNYTVAGDYTTVQAGGNTVTLKFKDYPLTTYHVNAQAGGSDIKTDMVTGSAYLDGSTTVYWSKYLKVGNQWYVADETTYGTDITKATTNVSYTATSDIDYFYEFETMSNSGSMQGGYSGTDRSGGNSQRLGGSGKKWTSALAGGVYTLDLYCYGYNAKSPKMDMYYCDSDGSNMVYIGETTACLAGSWQTKTTANVIIPDGKALCFYNNSSSNHNYIVDYMTLKKTAEFSDATITAKIGSTGYTTFASGYPLDLSNLPEGITAFTASEVGTESVKFIPATTAVAAGTGLLLKGTTNTPYDIPVVASGETISGNKMVGCPTATDLTPSESYYVLVNNNGTAEFRPLSGTYTNNKVTIPAGKAYLDVNAGTARALSIALDNEEVTGINNVQGSGVKTQGYFNLNGQRVAQPTKGLYIIDGRKVVVK